MKKWWSLLLLLLFSGAAFAANNASSPTIYSEAVANKTDLSIAYLSQVFGTVSGVLTGTSGQMLGKLLYQFNIGLLVVAGCWLGFSVLTIVFKSATQGSFMSQDNKVALIFLRVALGFGLLIPSPSTGYTVLQGIVMQVVVQGVKLANQVWEYGLDYMKAGGSLWRRPEQTGASTPHVTGRNESVLTQDDAHKILGDPSNASSQGMAQTILAAEACMIQKSIDTQNRGDNSNSSSGLYNTNSAGKALSVIEDNGNYKFQFPSSNTDNEGCGYVYWNSMSGASVSECGSGNDNTSCGFSRLAIRQVVFDLLPAAQRYVCAHPSNDGKTASECSNADTTEVEPYMIEAMFSAAVNYSNLILPLSRQEKKGGSGGIEQNNVLRFHEAAKQEGWLSAGRYYWDLSRVEAAFDQTYKQKPGAYLPNNMVNRQGNSPVINDLLSATRSTYIPKAVSSIGVFSNTSGKGDTGGAYGPGASAGANMAMLVGGSLAWLAGPIGGLLVEVGRIIMLFSTNAGPFGMGPDPILFLHKVGQGCISIAGYIWIGIIVYLVPLLLGANICRGQNPIGPTMDTVLRWIQPMLMAAAAAFLATGVMLSYYLPLYPYMIYTFGVIGWLILVIEAMVAAPLVALGITHPEGHDFLGSAKQATMLLLGVFMRPALMVIGLIASMILSYVSLRIMVYTYSGFVQDLFYAVMPINGAASGSVLTAAAQATANVLLQSTSPVGLVMSLLVFPLFLAIFAGMVYVVTTHCYSLIYRLPDYVGKWIGIPNEQSSAAQMAEKMHGSMSSGAKSMAAASSKGAAAAGKKRGGMAAGDIEM